MPLLEEFPSPLRTAAFAEAWTLWHEHRAEIRKPLKPTAIRMQLKRLASWGEQRAIAAVEYSISQGWVGIYEERAPSPQAVAAPTTAEAVKVALEMEVCPQCSGIPCGWNNSTGSARWCDFCDGTGRVRKSG